MVTDETINLVNARIQRLEDKHVETTMIIVRNNTLMEKFGDSLNSIQGTLEKLDTTLDGVQLNMKEMGNQISNVNRMVSEVKGNVEISSVKIKTLEDKLMFDIFPIIKANILKYVVGGGIVGLIAYIIDKVVLYSK